MKQVNRNHRDELNRLLRRTTQTRKHSAYQKIPHRLADLIDLDGIEIRPKHEDARFAYISSRIDLGGKSAVDIGANTGYFTFRMLDAGCSHVTAYEGAPEHYQFLKLAVEALGETGKVAVRHEYFELTTATPGFDVALLLNVVHHLGDDYGTVDISMADAKAAMLSQINGMTNHSRTLVLQMGFNWKGDIRKCLFDGGTKGEMIDFIAKGTADKWKIEHIGIATVTSGKIIYADLDESNVRRDDSLGEFLNRPIFILSAA